MDKLLISITEIAELTGFDANIDNDTIRPFIIMAESMEIKRALGIPLYNKIVADHFTNTLSGNYLILYNEYVAPMECYYTASYYLQLGVPKVSENGVYLVTPEKTEQIFDEKTNKMADKYEKLAIGIELRLVVLLDDLNLTERPSPSLIRPKSSFNWLKV